MRSSILFVNINVLIVCNFGLYECWNCSLLWSFLDFPLFLFLFEKALFRSIFLRFHNLNFFLIFIYNFQENFLHFNCLIDYFIYLRLKRFLHHPAIIVHYQVINYNEGFLCHNNKNYTTTKDSYITKKESYTKNQTNGIYVYIYTSN